jgi:hypothetical protein
VGWAAATSALVASAVACGGALAEPPEAGCVGSCPDANAAYASDGSLDASALRDASVEAGLFDGTLQDVTVQDAGFEEAAEADGPPTEASLPSTAPCLTGGNVLWLQADPASFWYAGAETLSDAAVWSSLEEANAYYFVWDGVYVQTMADDAGPGEYWTLQLNTWGLHAPLETGVVYDMAQGGGDLIGYMRSCGPTTGLRGQFRVDAFAATTLDGGSVDGDGGVPGGIGRLVTFTAAFWARCNNTADPGPLGVLQGCVHYQQ